MRVFLGANELLGLRHPSYADPLIAVCEAVGIDFSFRPDLECLFISSPAAGALVALRVDEPSPAELGPALKRLLRGAGAQVVSEVGLIGRRYGDVALRLTLSEGQEVTEVRYPWGSPASRVLAGQVAGALEQAGVAVSVPRAEFAGFGHRVPRAAVRVTGGALRQGCEPCVQGLFLGVIRFLWWRSLASPRGCAFQPLRLAKEE